MTVAHPHRSLMFASVAAGGVILIVTVLVARGSDRRPNCRTSLIPAYGSPGAIIEVVKGPARRRLVVINPANGPGPERQVSYGDAVRTAQDAGARVLGYVPTGYAARPAAQVVGDIDRYASWYGVDGIFLDEASHSAARLPYYDALGRRIHARPKRLMVVNPGVVPARGYFGIADVVVTYEGPYAEYAAAVDRMPKWVRRRPPERIAHLVYGASREQAIEVLESSGGAGNVFVTSGSLPDPWRELPPYLNEEELNACT